MNIFGTFDCQGSKLTDEQEASDAEIFDVAKQIGDRVLSLTPNGACPFCRNTTWGVLHSQGKSPVVMLENSMHFETYTLACGKCGFVRQHVKAVVDGATAVKA